MSASSEQPQWRRLSIFCAGWFLACSLTHVALPAQDLDFAPLERSIELEIEQLGLPGVSIALLDGNEIVWSRGFGYADHDRKVPLSGKSVHRVASISKLFTATAVMRLVEAGKLDLDRPLVDVLPDFIPDNKYDRPITLRQLLSHHSGLLREPAVGHYFAEGHSLEDLVHSLNGRALVYAPGTRFKYSNAAVSVAGLAVERAAGMPYEEYLQETVLTPLGLDHSSFAAVSSVAEGCAEGLMWTLDGRQFAAPTFELGMMPAANLYTSMENLVRFARSWFLDVSDRRGAVLSEASLRSMFRPQFGTDFIGLGFFVDEFRGHLRVGHNGAIYGFASQVFALPEKHLAVACAVTLDFANGSAERIAERALEFMLADPEQRSANMWPKAMPVGQAAAQALAGRYGDDEFWVELSEQDGNLQEIPSYGVPSTYWRYAESDAFGSLDRFRARPSELSLRAVDGGIERNGTFLPRIDAMPAPPEKRFEALIGEYGWDYDTVYIFEDAGKLCCLIEWFGRYPLEEHAADHFRMPDRGMYMGEELCFERDASGQVTALTVGAVRFARRELGVKDGATFKIVPLHAPERLRAMAAEARMPLESGEFFEPDLVDLSDEVPGLSLDIRYAGTNNFMGMKFYPEARALMQRPAAKALAEAQALLAELGYGLLIHDAYRPWRVTKMFWDATPHDMKAFVADPSTGSRHNRGCAVDLSLYRLETGEPVVMVSGYDEFTTRAYPNYPGGSSAQRWHRQLLRGTMEEVGFSVYDFEWWHFDYRDWRRYPILNQPIR